METIQNTELCNKSVLLIADYNVSISNGKIKSAFKINETLKTIKYIQDQSPKAFYIVTHLGRPKSRNECDLKPIFEYLSRFIPCINQKEIKDFNNKSQGIFFCDNSRYYLEGELKEFYSHFNVIVNDAFGCSHRPMPVKTCAGFLMQKEISALESVKNCDFLIIGGAKAKDKIELVKHFNSITFLGGLLAVGLMRSMGCEMGIGDEIIDHLAFSNRIKSQFNCDNINNSKYSIYLPVDFMVITKTNSYIIRNTNEILETDTIIDIGQQSIDLIKKLSKKSKLIFWNGPVGKFEDENAKSTGEIVKLLVESDAKVVVGGGETLVAAEEYSENEKFYHVSTGGGAMLNYLSGQVMPGIESLFQEK